MARQENILNRRRSWVIAATCAIVTAGFVSTAAAQPATPVATEINGIKFNPAHKKLQTEISTALREKVIQPGGQDNFDTFFSEYFFPQLILPAYRTDLPSIRAKFKVPSRQGKSGPILDRFNNLAFGVMKKIISAPFDIDVKYNAMLVIGDLNEQESDISLKLPVRPYGPALPLLLPVVKSDKMPDALKVAALIGIQRHAESEGLPPDSRTNIMNVMLDLLAAKHNPAVRSAEAHAWMQNRAAQVLGGLRDVGPSDSVVKALAAGLKDPSLALSTRCAMAQALGDLNYPSETKVDLGAIANDMGHLAVFACRQELAKKPAEPKPEDIVRMRRRLKSELNEINDGLGPRPRTSLGIATVAGSTPHKVFVDTIAKKLAALYKSLEDETQMANLEAKITDLASSLKPQGPATKGPAPAAAVDAAKAAAPVPAALPVAGIGN